MKVAPLKAKTQVFLLNIHDCCRSRHHPKRVWRLWFALTVEGGEDGETMDTLWCLQLFFKLHSLVVVQGIQLGCVSCLHCVVSSEPLSKARGWQWWFTPEQGKEAEETGRSSSQTQGSRTETATKVSMNPPVCLGLTGSGWRGGKVSVSEWLQSLGCAPLACTTRTLFKRPALKQELRSQFLGKERCSIAWQIGGSPPPPPPSLQAQGGSLITPFLSLWPCHNLWCLLLVKGWWGERS